MAFHRFVYKLIKKRKLFLIIVSIFVLYGYFKMKHTITSYSQYNGLNIPHFNIDSNRSLKTIASDPEDLFELWRIYEEKLCKGKFTGYYNKFARIRDIVLDSSYCECHQGGEEINDVTEQSEDKEFYKYYKGYMQMNCPKSIKYNFTKPNHLNQLMSSLEIKDLDKASFQESMEHDAFTILVTRYEYVNLYHQMTDWYASYLMMMFFKKNRNESHILLADGHPKGALDSIWTVLFNKTTRLSQLPSRTKFRDITLGLSGYGTKFKEHKLQSLPFVTDFVRFFLSSYKVPFDNRTLDCSALSVLFIWRRNYIAHPRNPEGKVGRKIVNEQNITSHFQSEYPRFRVRGLQLDVLPMEEQLNIVTNTDIMVGMHGAGLSHVLFLPSHAGVLEITNSKWANMQHFRAMARWRNLSYKRWNNSKKDKHGYEPEMNGTTVDVAGLQQVFEVILKMMECKP